MPTRIIYGTEGPDTITLPDGHDLTVTYDVIAYGLGGLDTITGGTGNDWVWGNLGDPSANRFSGGSDDDVLISYGFSNLLDGGAGDDVLILESPDTSSVIYGGDGNDSIWAVNAPASAARTRQMTLTDGGSGNDVIVAGGIVTGGLGDDLIIATQTFGSASGQAGNDRLFAQGNSQPFLNGGDGGDILAGNGHGELLMGGHGDFAPDTLIGASGIDSFYASVDATGGVDLIWNFELGVDQIFSDFTGYDWTGATASILPSYGWQAPDGSTVLLEGTLIRTVGETPIIFIAGQDFTMSQLMSANALK